MDRTESNMGYSPQLLIFMKSMVDQGLLPRSGRLLEMGAQELNPDVGAEAVRTLAASFPGNALTETDLGTFGGNLAGSLWNRLGVQYTSIDYFEAEFGIKMDLNKDDLPRNLVNTFDFVTNIGTTEHVANQYQAFKVIHEAMAVGGYAFHQVPFSGYVNHALIKYEPKFFAALVRANRYRVIACNFTPPHWVGLERHTPETGIVGADVWQQYDQPSGLISVLVRKETCSEYQPPLDIDMRVTRDIWEIDFSPAP
jgi:hypothetical protein